MTVLYIGMLINKNKPNRSDGRNSEDMVAVLVELIVEVLVVWLIRWSVWRQGSICSSVIINNNSI